MIQVQYFSLVIGVLTEASITLDPNSCSSYFNDLRKIAFTCQHINSEVSVLLRNSFIHPCLLLLFLCPPEALARTT